MILQFGGGWGEDDLSSVHSFGRVCVQEAALRAFYLPDEPQDYELQVQGQPPALLTDDIINRNGTPDDKSVFKDNAPDAWLLRAKPRDSEVLKIYADWLKYVTLKGVRRVGVGTIGFVW